MKTYNKLSVLIILSIFSISCGNLITPKEKDADSSGNTITGSMKAILDGKIWEAKKVSFGGLSALIQANGIIDDNSSISL